MTTPLRSAPGLTIHTVAPADPIGQQWVCVTDAGQLVAGMAYRRLGWPVTLCRHGVTLDLELKIDAVALDIPATLALATAEILTRRRCPPPVLAHSALPTTR